MKIYLDGDFRCHVSSGNGLTEIETDYFDEKASAFIEGYRYIPAGSTWIRSDGVEFQGEMVAPWKDWTELNAIQHEYVEQQNAELLSTIADMVEEVYTSDLEAMEA